MKTKAIALTLGLLVGFQLGRLTGQSPAAGRAGFELSARSDSAPLPAIARPSTGEGTRGGTGESSPTGGGRSVADVVARIAEELREPNTIARRSRLLELLLSVPVSEYQALVDSLGNELRLDRAFNLRQTMLLRWAKVDPRAALAFAEWLGPT